MVYSSFGNQTFLDMKLPVLCVIFCVSLRAVDFPAAVPSIVQPHSVGWKKNVYHLERKERDYAHVSAIALWSLVVAEMNIANRDYVAAFQEVLGDSFRIYKNAIPASPVDDTCCITVRLYDSVAATDVGRT